MSAAKALFEFIYILSAFIVLISITIAFYVSPIVLIVLLIIRQL